MRALSGTLIRLQLLTEIQFATTRDNIVWIHKRRPIMSGQIHFRRAVLGALTAAFAVLAALTIGGCAAPPPVEEVKLVWPAPPLPTQIWNMLRRK